MISIIVEGTVSLFASEDNSLHPTAVGFHVLRVMGGSQFELFLTGQFMAWRDDHTVKTLS
jgi:hypothetical protein